MTKLVPPPLVGFNNNFRYRGLSFHVQTEDSGLERPHIITHLFVDGGRVIKTLRIDYSEHVNAPDCRAVVQRMMRDQHRAMAYDLRQGRIDPIIDGLAPRETPPRETLPGTGDAARSDAAAGAGARSEQHEPTPPPAEPTPLSRARRSADAVAARAGAEVGADFVALPPDSLDELILRYVAGARGDGPIARARAGSRATPLRRPER